MIDPERIHGVSLDAYGTLVFLDRFLERMGGELARRGVVASQETLEQSCQAEIRYYVANNHHARDVQELCKLRLECAHILGSELKQRGVAQSMEDRDFLEVLMKSLQFRAYDDVLPALEGLTQRKLKLLVVSNWDCSLPDTLERLSLLGHFHAVFVSSICGSEKPDRGIFDFALEQAGLSPEEVVHVGDKWGPDVEGPLSAGIQPVYLQRNTRSPAIEGVPTITSLNQLGPLLDLALGLPDSPTKASSYGGHP
ncbi:MAG: HAD family hydrolase [Armatimonadetes bacterium]|nr:HAD family hydrolase [Armatimonadota bacterium]